MPKIHRLLSKGALAASLLSLTLAAASCDSIYDDEGDCSVTYRVPFRFTKNMLNADAFASQVSEVNLYLFDSSGRLAFHKKENRTLSTENDYYMEVDVTPGTYSMIAWCQGKSVIDSAVSFQIDNEADPAAIQDLGTFLQLKSNAGGLYSDDDINRLYYGLSENVVFADTYGTVNISPVYLTKDTNHITVQLLNNDGSPLETQNLQFSLSAANSELNWQNNVTGDTKFTYLPWTARDIYMEIEDEEENASPAKVAAATRADEVSNGVQVEFTTGRLIADKEQYLTVTNTESGDIVLRIPLVQYLLSVRNMYEQVTSDQDYLDRYDDFSLVFFVGDDLTWMKQRVLINGWRIVPPQDIEF